MERWAPRPSSLKQGRAETPGTPHRTGFVVRADAEQRGLSFGEFAHLTHFVHLVHYAAFRFFFLPLSFAFVLVPLLLLARLLFLTFAKS